MIVYLIVPELLVFVMCMLIRTVHCTVMLPLLTAAVLIKYVYFRMKPDIAIAQLQLPASFMMLEMGSVLLLYSGYGSRTMVWLTAVLFTGSITAGYMVLGWLRKQHPVIPFRVSCSLLIAGTGILAFLYRMLAQPINSCYNWLSFGGVTIQFSEVLKLIIVSEFAASVKAVKKHPYAILVFYAAQIWNVFLMGGVIKEWGSALQLVYATLILGCLVQKFSTKTNASWKEYLTSAYLPLGSLAAFSIALRASRTALEHAAASGVNMNNTVFHHSLGFWAQRLTCTNEETVAAKAFIEQAPFIRANLTDFTAFKKIHSSVLTDYTFSLLVNNFGTLIPTMLILLFAAAMVQVIVRHRRNASKGDTVSAIAVATAVLLLIQTALHIFGTLSITAYTGISLPVVSKGYSGQMMIAFLLSFTEFAPDNKKN